MITIKQIFASNNKNLLEKLIPEKGSDFEYTTGLKFTDPFDLAFDHPFECSLPHLLSEQLEEEQPLFI